MLGALVIIFALAAGMYRLAAAASDESLAQLHQKNADQDIAFMAMDQRVHRLEEMHAAYAMDLAVMKTDVSWIRHELEKELKPAK
jgi:hypothetical protein